MVQLVEVIFNNKPSKHNKDLTDFLKRNLRAILVKGHVRFQFTIARTRDLKELRNKGINRLPAMIIKDKNFIGVPNIVQELHARVKNSKKQAPPKSEEEVLQDFFTQQLGVTIGEDGKHIVPDDDEYGNDGSDNRMSQVSKEMERRNITQKGLDLDQHDDRVRKNNRPSGPSNTRKNTRSETDFETPQRPSRPPNAQSRMDNIDTGVGDAIEVLNKMRPAQDSRDDDMMRQLLEKMSDDVM